DHERPFRTREVEQEERRIVRQGQLRADTERDVDEVQRAERDDVDVERIADLDPKSVRQRADEKAATARRHPFLNRFEKLDEGPHFHAGDVRFELWCRPVVTAETRATELDRRDVERTAEQT